MRSIILICLILIVVTLPVNAGEQIIFSINSAEAFAGQEVTLPIFVQNNRGFASFIIDISYDSTLLTPVKAEKSNMLKGQFISNLNYKKEDATGSAIRIVFAGTENIVENGQLAALTFKVSDSVNQDIYTELNLDASFLADENSLEISCSTLKGGISILKNNNDQSSNLDNENQTQSNNYHNTSTQSNNFEAINSDAAKTDNIGKSVIPFLFTDIIQLLRITLEQQWQKMNW